jgi:hypothetical protein
MNAAQWIGVVALSAFAAGCTGKRVLFTTQTSLGVDVSGTTELPNKISFAYKRAEGAIVPAKVDENGKPGEAHSIYGGVDSDTRFFTGQIIKQTFATGDAAALATIPETDPAKKHAQDYIQSQITNNLSTHRVTSKGESPSRPALVFVTGTTYGLNLHIAGEEVSPNLVVGYKRSENAFVPVHDPTKEVNSVYADLLINTVNPDKVGTKSITTNFSTINGGGVRLKQAFATGLAAKQLSFDANVRQRLQEAAGIKATQERIEDRRKRAGLLADAAATVLEKVPDDRLDGAGELAIAKQLLAEQIPAFKAKTPAAKRTDLKAALRGGTNGRSSENELAAVEEILNLLRSLSN